MKRWKEQGRGEPAPDSIGWLKLIGIWAVAFIIAGLVAGWMVG